MSDGYGLWEEDKTAFMGLRFKIKPKCIFCSGELALFSTKLIEFPLDGGKARGQAIDVMLYCPACGYIDTFGVAVTREHYERLHGVITKMTERAQIREIDPDRNYIQEKNVSDGVSYPNVQLWDRTDDELGHTPRFDIKCYFCGSAMTLRHATSHYHDKEECKRGLNQMCYKCSKCAWFVRFNVTDDKEYLQKLHEIRGKKGHIPTIKEWSEDEEIARQLEAMGYYGGR